MAPTIACHTTAAPASRPRCTRFSNCFSPEHLTVDLRERISCDKRVRHNSSTRFPRFSPEHRGAPLESTTAAPRATRLPPSRLKLCRASAAHCFGGCLLS